jgi:hypothetical protein
MSIKKIISKKIKPIRYEVWIRIACPDTDCGGWTGMTLRDRPETIRCVICDLVIPIGTLDEDGKAFEYRRRGPWTRPLLSPQEQDAIRKRAEEKKSTPLDR